MTTLDSMALEDLKGMIEEEYQFLTGLWDGPKEAAYNAVYDFCHENGWCYDDGRMTPKGAKAVDQYERFAKAAKESS